MLYQYHLDIIPTILPLKARLLENRQKMFLLQVQLNKDFVNCLEEVNVNYSKNEIILVCGDFNLPYI